MTDFLENIKEVFSSIQQKKVHEGTILYKGSNYICDPIADQIFLWKAKDFPIYIMDNHRSALWCWEQELGEKKVKNVILLHIDRHPDSVPYSGMIGPVPSNINDYLSQKDACGNIVFSWDNYIDYFEKIHKNVIKKDFSNDNKPVSQWKSVLNELKKNALSLDDFFIINFDLDSIFTPNGNKTKNWDKHLVSFLYEIKRILQSRCSQLVVTIALSPTCCYKTKTINRLTHEIKVIERELDINCNLWDCLAVSD